MPSRGVSRSIVDVKLPVLAGGLMIVAVAEAGADDVTLGTGNLTLNVVGPVTQVSGNVITAAGLQLLGSGTVTLNDSGNNVSTLAANYNGPITYTNANNLTIGTATDGPSAMTASGITTSNDDVKLTVLAGGLTIGAVADAGADDVTLGTGTFPTRRSSDLTQVSGNVITAAGLQLLGSGTVTLNDSGNNVITLAANYNGPIGYTDADALTIGTVGTSIGITTGNPANGGDVTITSGGVLTVD